MDIPEGISVVRNRELDLYQGFDKNGDWKINPKILNVVISDEN